MLIAEHGNHSAVFLKRGGDLFGPEKRCQAGEKPEEKVTEENRGKSEQRKSRGKGEAEEKTEETQTEEKVSAEDSRGKGVSDGLKNGQ